MKKRCRKIKSVLLFRSQMDRTGISAGAYMRCVYIVKLAQIFSEPGRMSRELMS